MENIREFIKSCQTGYYTNGISPLSDVEYDALIRRFPLEDEIGPKGDIPHLYRMYSLNKVYPNRGESLPFSGVESDKIDGCAVSLLYHGGRLVQGLTRGNGILGNEVPSITLLNIPKEIPQSLTLQITGEVHITKQGLDNMRNYASGAINLKDPNEFLTKIKEGGLVFTAYSVQASDTSVGLTGTYTEDMSLLSEWGFITCLTAKDIYDWYPTDGIVIRTNSNNEYFRQGWTNKHPRAAYAIKEDEEGVETVLTNVTWQVGASGKVTPVGWFEPITIDDATIVKATLNNVDYIKSLDLELGCRIRVIRAGGVIPKIIERIYD